MSGVFSSSGRGTYFDVQKEQANEKHPAQTAKKLSDAEKIEHLKNEVDNLRSQLGQEATGDHLLSTMNANAAGASATAHSANVFPVLTVLCAMTLCVVALWRRRQQRQRSQPYSTRRVGMGIPGASHAMMALELQDTNTSTTANTAMTSPSAFAYRAPETTVSFV